jgi:PPM family protein phosphatase
MRTPLPQRSASVTECGRRSVNQDAVLVATLADGAELIAVADGMGGHMAGEVASARAVAALREAVEAGNSLVDAMGAANAAVFAESRARPECAGMGTTLVALLRRGDRYTIANVGDSRAYRLDETGIHQITLDHSFVAEAVRSGQLTLEEAEKSRWRNAVTRVVGTDTDVDIDCFGPFDATQPHTIILCTDGLYRGVDDATLLRTAANGTGPDDAARQLATAAFDAGSDDNISIVVARFGADRPQHAAPAPARTRSPGTATPAAAPAASRPEPARRQPGPAPEAAPTPPPALAEPPRRRSRRRKQHRRWTSTEVSIIFAGVILVILYVVLLRLVL